MCEGAGAGAYMRERSPTQLLISGSGGRRAKGAVDPVIGVQLTPASTSQHNAPLPPPPTSTGHTIVCDACGRLRDFGRLCGSASFASFCPVATIVCDAWNALPRDFGRLWNCVGGAGYWGPWGLGERSGCCLRRLGRFGNCRAGADGYWGPANCVTLWIARGCAFRVSVLRRIRSARLRLASLILARTTNRVTRDYALDGVVKIPQGATRKSRPASYAEMPRSPAPDWGERSGKRARGIDSICQNRRLRLVGIMPAERGRSIL